MITIVLSVGCNRMPHGSFAAGRPFQDSEEGVLSVTTHSTGGENPTGIQRHLSVLE